MAYSLYPLFDAVQKRPGLLPVESVQEMFIFLTGYAMGADGYENVANEINQFQKNFQEWVVNFYNVEDRTNWANIIRYHCTSDRESLEKFYELLALFRKF